MTGIDDRNAYYQLYKDVEKIVTEKVKTFDMTKLFVPR
jgi:hypothetical protein